MPKNPTHGSSASRTGAGGATSRNGKRIFKPKFVKKPLFHQQSPVDLRSNKKIQKLGSHNDTAAFTKNSSNKLSKIKKRTLMCIPIDKYQVKFAIEALMVNRDRDLLQNDTILKFDDFIYLDILLTQKLPTVTIKPILINLPEKIFYKEFKSKTALIVSDLKAVQFLTSKEEDRKLLEARDVKVFDMETFKAKFLAEKKMTVFLATYSVVVVEDRIFEAVRKRAYKEFMNKRVLPYPIEIGDKEVFLGKLDEVLGSVVLVKTVGPMHSIRLGRCCMSVKANVKNVVNGAYDVIPHLLLDSAKGTNVEYLRVRTKDSVQVPIFKREVLEEEE